MMLAWVAGPVPVLKACGVDVEHCARTVSPLELAPTVFAEAELARLAAETDAAAQRERFFAYWTLKEAYIKARGLGLALPLKSFSFRVETGEAPCLLHSASDNEFASGWLFGRETLNPDVRLAWAVARRPNEALDVSLRERADSFGALA